MASLYLAMYEGPIPLAHEINHKRMKITTDLYKLKSQYIGIIVI